MGTLENLLITKDYAQFVEFEKFDHESRAQEEATLAIREQTKAFVNEMQENNRVQNEIAQSSRDMNSKLDDININIQEGFAGLGALFDWRMKTVITLLEQQQVTLSQIYELLRYPRKTQADEDKESGRKAWKAALNMPEGDWLQQESLSNAMEFYKSAAEKNPLDYTVHFDIGLLLLQDFEQPDQALKYFHRAALYSQTAGDKEYESKSYFYNARAHELVGNLEEAYKSINASLSLKPETPVIVYESARFGALTNRTDNAAEDIGFLLRPDIIGGKIALVETKAWWIKIMHSPEFKSMHKMLADGFMG